MFVIFIILDTALLLTFTFETVNFFSRPQIYNGTIWGIVQYYYIVTVDAQNQKCVQHGNIIVKAQRKEGNKSPKISTRLDDHDPWFIWWGVVALYKHDLPARALLRNEIF